MDYTKHSRMFNLKNGHFLKIHRESLFIRNHWVVSYYYGFSKDCEIKVAGIKVKDVFGELRRQILFRKNPKVKEVHDRMAKDKRAWCAQHLGKTDGMW